MTQNNIILGGFIMEAMMTVLKAIIKRANLIVDNPSTVYSFDYIEGEIAAYLNAIEEIEKALNITVEVNPINGHLYIAK